MTPSRRFRRGVVVASHRDGERGASLVLALSFITIIGVVIVAVLGLATTSFRAVSSARDERYRVYSADGAMETALEGVRANPVVGSAAGPCPAAIEYAASDGQPAATVTCDVKQPRGPGVPGDNMPEYALAALGTSAAEAGISIGQGTVSTKKVSVGGPVASASPKATSSIEASSPLVVDGFPVTATGGCSTGVSATSPSDLTCNTGTPLVDPGYAHRALPDPDNPANYNPTPVCAAPNATLQHLPGYYTDVTLFESTASTVLQGCRSGYRYFRPGVYVLDLGFGGGDAIWDLTGVIIGGTPKGWDPNTGNPPANLAAQIGVAPASVLCKTEVDDVEAGGVQFILAGTTQLVTKNATPRPQVELCAAPSPAGSGQQQIAIYGQRAGTVSPRDATVAPSAAAQTGSVWTPWPPVPAYAIDRVAPPTEVARTTIQRTPTTDRSTTLTLSGFGATVIPKGSTVQSATLRVSHRETGDPLDLTTLTYRVTPAGATACAVTNLAKNVAAVAPTFVQTSADVTACLNTPAKLTGFTVQYAAALRNTSAAKAVVLELDGVEVDIRYTRPAARTQDGCVTTLGGCPALNIDTGQTSIAVWGTVYAPLAKVQASFRNASVFQFRRGVLARAVTAVSVPSADTSTAFCLGYGNPCTGPSRLILFESKVAGVARVRTLVQYADAPTLGRTSRVLTWNTLR